MAKSTDLQKYRREIDRLKKEREAVGFALKKLADDISTISKEQKRGALEEAGEVIKSTDREKIESIKRNIQENL